MKITLPGNVCVIGLQWGDEGKGKMVNLMTDPDGPCGRFDMVVRYGGGANAGHTVVIGSEKYAMHLVPSGIIWPSVMCVIANGVVLDPEVVLSEVSGLRERGIKITGENFRISSKAHVVMPWHKMQDKLSEAQLGKASIGTTCRGIGPCYADKANRSWGFRLGELYDAAKFREKLNRVVAEKNTMFQALYGQAGLNADEICSQSLVFAKALEPFVCDTTELLHRQWRAGKRMMFEGAQGSLLDIDHGTYPYVTSSNCTSGGLFTGTGMPAQAVTSYLGIIKAYSTRVGAGPFPSELDNDLGEYIRRRGREYGTTTGRPRRTGWFDAVATRYSVAVNGTTALAVMLLDVLTGLDSLKIATGYRQNGKLMEFFPGEANQLVGVEAVYEELPGWSEDISTVRQQKDLPAATIAYLRRIQELLDCPIRVVSVGPEKSQTIPVEL